MFLRSLANAFVPLVDVIFAPLVLIAAILMKYVRRLGIWRMPVSKYIFNRVGVYPLRDHYYDPLFNHKKYLKKSLRAPRTLPGIELNENIQLGWLDQFNYADELSKIPLHSAGGIDFYYQNPNFAEGDAECLYSLIRARRPQRIIEIGSGFSTMMARKAIAKNQLEDPSYKCKHICIEPYEMKWLDGLGEIEILRQKVEEMDVSLFRQLEEDDILFID
jgi:hypothetical protein